MLIVNFILITALAGWWLSSTEISGGFSGLAATGVVRSRYWGLGIIIFIIIGGCLFGNLLNGIIVGDTPLTTPGSSTTIAISAFIATLVTYKLSRFSSVCYGILGALLGWGMYVNDSIDCIEVLRLVLSWLIAPLLTAVIAFFIYRVYCFFIRKSSIHILILARYLRGGLIIAAILFALAIGMNNSILFIILNETISPGFDFFINNLDVKDQYILLFFSFLLIALITWKSTFLKINTLSEREFDINIESVLVMLIAGVLVLMFFSIPAVCLIGLTETPLSIAGIVLGGFAGINIVKKEKGIAYNEEGRFLLSVIITPLVSFGIAYFIFNIVDTHTLVAKGSKIAIASRGVFNITPVIIAALAFTFLFLVLVYLRKQRRMRIQAEIILLENQNKLFENQKAMSALEIKTVVTENESLNTKLELRRKELINIALGITEQKIFQEILYLQLKELKNLNDVEDLHREIEDMERQLLQKMNFSEELESFYAQIENLHRDFNLRLSEKHPDLTEQERRLTTLLRLGFSSKHIASLMNISPKSVEMSRYRLRNKLALDHDQKLITYIRNI